MGTLPVIQPSFAAGELSPFLYGRVDLAKFHVGARTMQNFFVHPQGGASNRGGTRFVGEVDNSTVRHRLIPFQFRTLPAGQTYALVFGNLTMQVVMFNGTSWGFVQSSPGVPFTLATPYAAADLARLKYVQSADTMTLTHPSYAAMSLTRTGHAAWTLATITFAPRQTAPVNIVSSAPGTAAIYAVTAIASANGEESLQSADVGSSSQTSTLSWPPLAGVAAYNVYKKAATGAVYGFIGQVQAPPSGNVGFTDATIAPDVGNTPPQQRNPLASNSIGSVTVVSGGAGYGAPKLAVVDPSGLGGTAVLTAILSGGAITGVTVVSGGSGLTSPTIVISDGAGAGASIALGFTPDGGQVAVAYYSDGTVLYTPTYSISSATVVAGGSGYHAGVALALAFPGGAAGSGAAFSLTVSGGVITAVAVTSGGSGYYNYNPVYFPTAVITDSAGSGAVLTAVVVPNPLANASCSTYYLQRQVFAASLAQPQTLWFSDVGAFNNMAVSQPTRDSDAITRTLTGQQVNEVRHLVPLGANMLIMTSGAEWRCWPGPAANALSPAACFTLPQTVHGCSHVPPVYTENTLIFVQEKGSVVQGLTYDALQDLYISKDLSVLASHMLADTGYQYQIQEWAFAAVPDKIVWGVRSDGVLLGLTYMREHDVTAWHRHITDGAVESVCTITEANGQGGYEDAVYLIVNRTIGNVTRRYVERLVTRMFPTIAQAWFVDCGLQYSGAPVTSVSGLGHLIGKTVAILGDGSVVPSQVVDNTGTVQLDGAYSTVTVGLPYSCQLETLNLELAAGGGTSQGQMKKIAQVTIRVKDARGVQIGLNSGPSAAPEGAVAEVKQRSSETLGSAMQPYSGDWAVEIPSEWNRDGRLFVQQVYPLPCTILDLIPKVEAGD